MGEEMIVVLPLDLLSPNLGGSLESSQASEFLLNKSGRNISALVSKLRGSRARDVLERDALHR